MTKYIIRRLLGVIPTLLVIITISFLLSESLLVALSMEKEPSPKWLREILRLNTTSTTPYWYNMGVTCLMF